MPKLSEVFSGNFLKAQDLPPNKTVQVKIEEIEVKEFDDGKKIILKFAGKEKGLVCNKTNASIIEEVTGSDDTDDWIDKTIYLTVRKVDYQGKRVPAIRVLAPDEMPSKSAPPAADNDGGDDTWDA
jgi:hypothetical protein